MTLEQLKEKGKCCISDKPLKDSEHINMVQLEFKATWEYPVCGNVTYGIEGMAVAYVHDEFFVDGKVDLSKVKYAVEFAGDDIIYHPVPVIRRCRVCGCHKCDACHHPVYGNCWWAEQDLCSHCKNIPGQAKRHSQIIAEVESEYFFVG